MFRPNFARALRLNTIVGLVVITPVVLTIFIVNFLFNFVVNTGPGRFLRLTIARALPPDLQEAGYALLILKILVFIIVLLILAFIGFVARSLMGRKLYALGDRLLAKIPGINKIYLFIRQISESLVAQRETLFKEVVLVEYPRKGTYALAFVTAAMPADFREQVPVFGEEDYISLFVPTTPNPTSGFFIIVSRKEITPLHIDLSSAMKLIFSAGALYPGVDRPELNTNLLTRLESLFEKRKAAEPDG